MNPISANISAMRNIVKFKSRAPRSEYWWVVLTLIFGVCLFAYIDQIEFTEGSISSRVQDFILIIMVGLYIVWLLLYFSVTLRRLRDMDLTAWALLIFIMPLGLGFIAMAIVCSIKGTAGPNRFGPDPHYVDVFSDVDEFG